MKWKEPLAGSARALLAQDGGRSRRALELWRKPRSFLRSFLAGRPVSPKEVKSAAEANGISWASIKRAKKKLGVEAQKGGFDDGWAWSLPKGLKNPKRLSKIS